MAVTPVWMHSGAGSNADPNADLGGAISSAAVSATKLNNVFDDTTGDEAAAGHTEYRCQYIKNTGATSWVAPVLWSAHDTGLVTEGRPHNPASPYVLSGETFQFGVEAVRATIATSSIAAATVITTSAPHKLADGATVVIAGHIGSTPAVDGTYVATVTGADTFTIPLTVSTGGTGGTVTGAAAKNTTAQTIAAGGAVAPLYVVFASPYTKVTGTPLPVATLATNDYVAVWMKWITPSSQAYSAGTDAILLCEGDDA